nr:hypothetical protein KPHV_86990 [Kitasatospora purpeofusca]
MAQPLPGGYTATSVLVIKEIGVRTPWRRADVARCIHDSLLAARTEDRVTLMVNPLAGSSKVQRLYETRGYEAFNALQPSTSCHGSLPWSA